MTFPPGRRINAINSIEEDQDLALSDPQAIPAALPSPVQTHTHNDTNRVTKTGASGTTCESCRDSKVKCIRRGFFWATLKPSLPLCLLPVAPTEFQRLSRSWHPRQSLGQGQQEENPVCTSATSSLYTRSQEGYWSTPPLATRPSKRALSVHLLGAPHLSTVQLRHKNLKMGADCALKQHQALERLNSGRLESSVPL